MTCYYSIDGGEWIKGAMETVNSVDVCVCPSDNTRDARDTLLFRDPEIAFGQKYIHVTGYRRVSDRDKAFQLVSVDVSPGWVEPQ